MARRDVRHRRDGLAVDYRRDGDPTYLRPLPSRVWAIDTKTGAVRAVLPDKRDVGALRWSPDASRLAMLVRKGDAWQRVLWERASGRLTTIPLPNGTYPAEQADLRWSGDGRSVVLSLHTTAWRDSVRAQFARQTEGPIFVQSSKDPFLAWDELRRRARGERLRGRAADGGHGAGNASEADYRDYVARVPGWYDSHLNADPKKKVAAAGE